jgi:hypothetical protein
VIYLSVANIVFQSTLTAVMWAFTQYTRPAWAPALCVALALGTIAAGGGMRWWEGRRVRRERRQMLDGLEGVEGLTQSEAWEAARTRRREKWTVEYYGRLWTREKRNWIVIHA